MKKISNKPCKHWREYDTESGKMFEYCKVVKESVTCSGSEFDCNHPLCFNAPKHKLKQLYREYHNNLSIQRAEAIAELGGQ